MLGGLERYVGDLARAQARNGYDVTVVTLDRDVNRIHVGQLPKIEYLDAIRVVRLPGLGSGRFAFTLRPDRFIRIVRRSDVTHIHDLRFMIGTVAVVNWMRSRPTIL